jgi:prolyl-tRNA editing enzyme YbaK/EbsC (Cys-tRNA(Pro) deacylase)
MHPSAEKVARALAEAGVTGEVRELETSARTAAEAAAALGCEVGAIANSLIFMAGDQALLILTSGAHRVDTAHVSDHLGGLKLRRATPEEVRSATGQAIGGVAPIGHPAPVRTLIDTALRAYDRIWAAGGTPKTIFPTVFDELRRISSAEEVSVTREP